MERSATELYTDTQGKMPEQAMIQLTGSVHVLMKYCKGDVASGTSAEVIHVVEDPLEIEQYQ